MKKDKKPVKDKKPNKKKLEPISYHYISDLDDIFHINVRPKSGLY